LFKASKKYPILNSLINEIPKSKFATSTIDDLSFLLSNLLFEQAKGHPKLLPKLQTQNLLFEIENFPTQF
jgi:hypothetical protein